MWALAPVTIDVPCPEPVAPVVNIPPLLFGTALPDYVLGWAIVILIGLILGTFISIWVWMDGRPDRQKEVLAAKVAIAKAHNSCQNCGVRYAPKLEDIDVDDA